MISNAGILRDFIDTVATAYHNQDGEYLAELFVVDPNDGNVQQLMQALQLVPEAQYHEQISNVLDDVSISLANLTTKYADLVVVLHEQNLDLVFQKLEQCYNALIPVFNSSEGAMLVPLVVNLSSILVSYAFHTDAVLALDGKARKANAAARLLSRVFNTMLADRSGAENGRSKREGIISLINFTFKVYFKLDTVRMCQTMIANLQKSGVDIEQYPIGQQVTYQFYLGRYQFLQNRLRAAEKCLLFAFTRCHADYWHNKRLILKYLIPTRLLLGQFPSHNLLVTYDLHQQYAELIDALKTGNYARCIAVLEANFDFFYATAAYEFLLERLPVLLWRTALKKMHVLRCQMNNGAPNVLPLADCAMALQISMKHHEDVDADFVENVIVTLINQGYIKGYVHHRRQIAVVSKMNAFPKISNVHLTTEIYDEELEREHLALMEEQDAMAMG